MIRPFFMTMTRQSEQREHRVKAWRIIPYHNLPARAGEDRGLGMKRGLFLPPGVV